jgi:hypothetical protein
LVSESWDAKHLFHALADITDDEVAVNEHGACTENFEIFAKACRKY